MLVQWSVLGAITAEGREIDKGQTPTSGVRSGCSSLLASRLVGTWRRVFGERSHLLSKDKNFEAHISDISTGGGFSLPAW
jgi:hypothetical protein